MHFMRGPVFANIILAINGESLASLDEPGNGFADAADPAILHVHRLFPQRFHESYSIG